jgi:predicted alpha/beta superfamily hydrolase
VRSGGGLVRASLFGTRQHELSCGHRGRSYVLSVALPEFYHDSDKRYPVVYVLDGDALFGMVASLTVCAVWAQEAPELIAVGIGYGVDSYDEGHNPGSIALTYLHGMRRVYPQAAS